MIDCLVFSKDRACQLDLLLRSIDRHAPGIYNLTVLWTATRPAFEDGYMSLWAERPQQMWLRQQNFAGEVRAWWRNTSEPHVSFLVDDDVFFRPLPPITGLPFAPRLGFNTHWCQPQGRSQQVPPCLSFKWRGYTGDFGYPLSLDGTIYRRDQLAPLLEQAPPFNDPTQLEVALAIQADRCSFDRLTMAEYSSLTSVPHNRVTASSRNPVTGWETWQPEPLNQAWLRGEQISLDAIEQQASTVRSPHTDLAYLMEPRRG